MIRTVVFDLGNVLLPFNWQIAADRFCARVKRPRRDLQDYLLSMPFVQQLESGRLSGMAFYRRLAADFAFPGDYDEFAQIWSDIFSADDAMLALAAQLKGQVPRLILSNTNEIHVNFVFAKFPAIRDFDGHVFSHEVGAMKPDRRIYEATVSRFGLIPEQTVFIDDILANVEGARAAGWQGIVHRDAQSTRAELTKLGVPGI